MNRLLKTSLLTTMIVVLSLYLTACGNDEKAKPTAEKSAPEQTGQLAVKPEAPAPVTPPPTAATEINPESDPKTTPATQSDATGHSEILTLAKKSGCLSCHTVDKKIVGPAWKDVAARYKGNTGARALLIEKVSKGGRGNWSDVVGNAAMPPYFPRASKENIGKLVDFVLSL